MSEEQAPYFANTGDMIRHIRRSKRITVVELAAKMGVSQAYIAGIELGDVEPTQEQIEALRSFIDGRL